MLGGIQFVIYDPLHIQLKQSVPKTTKEKPESNEYNWSTEYEGI